LVPEPDSTSGQHPQQGITLDAYNNCSYSYTFELFVADSMSIGPSNVEITSLEVISVLNLPTGLTFQCDPPTCFFTPNSQGSIILSGIPNDTPTDYFVEIETEFATPVIPVPIDLNFPNATVAPGNIS